MLSQALQCSRWDRLRQPVLLSDGFVVSLKLQCTVPLGPIETSSRSSKISNSTFCCNVRSLWDRLRRVPKSYHTSVVGPCKCCNVRSRWDRLRRWTLLQTHCMPDALLQSTVPLGPIETNACRICGDITELSCEVRSRWDRLRPYRRCGGHGKREDRCKVRSRWDRLRVRFFFRSLSLPTIDVGILRNAFQTDLSQDSVLPDECIHNGSIEWFERTCLPSEQTQVDNFDAKNEAR